MKYCVYVLHLNNMPIYVGMTSNLIQRISSHKLKGKEFDSYVKIESFDNRKDALICERGIIKYLSIFKSKSITNGLYDRFCNSLIYGR